MEKAISKVTNSVFRFFTLFFNPFVFPLLFLPLSSSPSYGATSSREEDEKFIRMYYGVSESCLVCHGDYNFFEAMPGTRKYYYIDRQAFSRSVHFKLGCLACHEPMKTGVHGSVSNKEKPQTSTKGFTEEELKRLSLCDGCHFEQLEQYRESVHGVAALSLRVAEAPLCVDCHGSHYILSKEDPESHTNPNNVPVLCAKCHGKSEIYAKYGLSPDVVISYSESFHGKKEALGYEPVPVCISCHDTHLIYSSDDKRSLVNDINISRTCGRCHPGATKGFKAAFSHRKVTPLQKAILFYVEQFYLWFIFITIGGMIVVIGLNLTFHVRRSGAK